MERSFLFATGVKLISYLTDFRLNGHKESRDWSRGYN